MSNLATCFFCQSFKGTTFAAVVRHIGSVHIHEPGFSISCGVEGCPQRSTRPYENFASYKKHLYRHHPEIFNVQSGSPEHGSGGEQCPSQISDPINDDSDSELDTDTHTPRESLRDKEQFKRSAALFILKTAEVRKLTLTAVNGILEDVQQLVERAVVSTEMKVCALLRNAGVDPSQLPELHQVFTDEQVLNPFLGIQTEHMQVKYFRENFGFVQICIMIS